MKCPKCNSEEITAIITVCAISVMDMKTKEIELPDYAERYDNEYLGFDCQDCEHEWGK